LPCAHEKGRGRRGRRISSRHVDRARPDLRLKSGLVAKPALIFKSYFTARRRHEPGTPRGPRHGKGGGATSQAADVDGGGRSALFGACGIICSASSATRSCIEACAITARRETRPLAGGPEQHACARGWLGILILFGEEAHQPNFVAAGCGSALRTLRCQGAGCADAASHLARATRTAQKKKKPGLSGCSIERGLLTPAGGAGAM